VRAQDGGKFTSMALLRYAIAPYQENRSFGTLFEIRLTPVFVQCIGTAGCPARPMSIWDRDQSPDERQHSGYFVKKGIARLAC
jgi:hypothetical protein